VPRRSGNPKSLCQLAPVPGVCDRAMRMCSLLVALCAVLALHVVVAVAEPVADCRSRDDLQRVMMGCSQILQSNGSSPEHRKRAYNNRANALRLLGRNNEALADYGRALAIDPHYTAARYNRGTVYLANEEWDLAIADFDGVLKLEPARADAYNNRGLAELNRGQIDQAIADFSTGIRLDPAAAYLLNNRGVAHRRKGLSARALEDFSAAIALNPNFVAALNNRGEVLLEEGGQVMAEQDFRKALAVDPSHVGAFLNLSRLGSQSRSERRAKARP
jgi:tetratricopeptide (TPR) repeat protein